MTHCAKCGAELIGSRKFCAACGTPAGDPRSPAASTGLAPVMSGRMPGNAPGSAPGSSPSNPGSNPGSGPSIQYAPPPASHVNPFAQTAGPLTNRQPAPDYGPPPSIPPELGVTTPGVGEPAPPLAAASANQVSPLAVSNVNSQRGAFENAVTAGPASTAAVAAGLVGVIAHPENTPSQSGVKRSAVAGTQMMPSSANPAAPLGGAAAAGGAPSGAGAGAPSKRQDRTQLLAAFPPGTASRPGAPAPPGAGVGAPSGSGPAAPPAAAQSAGSLPVAEPQRISSVPNLAAAYAPPQQQQTAPAQPPVQPPVQPQMPPVMQPPQPPMQPPAPPMQPPGAWSPAAASYAVGQPSPVGPYAAPSPYAQPPMQPQPMPPQPMAPAPAPPAYGFGFAYVPGSRVTVTWSNGGRYPGTVQQVSGTQCLVVFPDGQQHWVEMQYVAPA